MDLTSRIAYLEGQGVSPDSFVEAWARFAQQRLHRDPTFNAMLLSGSAWKLAELRPAWKEALHDRLVEGFLGPWLDACFSRFEMPRQVQVRLRWEGHKEVVERGEARSRLRTGGLIPEISGLQLTLEADEVLDWEGAPPTDLTLSGRFREIHRLARPSNLELVDCPHLEGIRHLRVASGVMWVRHAPKLVLEQTRLERAEGGDGLLWTADLEVDQTGTAAVAEEGTHG